MATDHVTLRPGYSDTRRCCATRGDHARLAPSAAGNPVVAGENSFVKTYPGHSER